MEVQKDQYRRKKEHHPNKKTPNETPNVSGRFFCSYSFCAAIIIDCHSLPRFSTDWTQNK
jgi:hypothetical protein